MAEKASLLLCLAFAELQLRDLFSSEGFVHRGASTSASKRLLEQMCNFGHSSRGQSVGFADWSPQLYSQQSLM